MHNEMKSKGSATWRLRSATAPNTPSRGKGLIQLPRLPNACRSYVRRIGVSIASSGPWPYPHPFNHSWIADAASGGCPSPGNSGATGLPNRRRFTKYHKPPDAAAAAAATIVLVSRRLRPQQNGTQAITATGTTAPEYLAPAAKPANKPAAAAAPNEGRGYNTSVAATVIAITSMSSLADEARNAAAGQPSNKIGASQDAAYSRARRLANDHSRTVTRTTSTPLNKPSRRAPESRTAASSNSCDNGYAERAWS